jgi:hypothetical protein
MRLSCLGSLLPCLAPVLLVHSLDSIRHDLRCMRTRWSPAAVSAWMEMQHVSLAVVDFSARLLICCL